MLQLAHILQVTTIYLDKWKCRKKISTSALKFLFMCVHVYESVCVLELSGSGESLRLKPSEAVVEKYFSVRQILISY